MRPAHYDVEDGTVQVPSIASGSCPVIVQITFVPLSGEPRSSRLDVQKAMFIDVVSDAWSADYTRAIARVVSQDIREVT